MNEDKTIQLYDKVEPQPDKIIGRCYVCETFVKSVLVKEFVVEQLCPYDGMCEQIVELPVCEDADACEKNVMRNVTKQKKQGRGKF